MTFHASPGDHDIPAEKPLDLAFEVHPDLENALLEGLSDMSSLSTEDPGSADLPDVSEPVVAHGGSIPGPENPAAGIDADFEAMLLDGLSDGPPDSSADLGTPDLPADTDPPAVAGDAVPEEAEPAVALDADFESALLEGLSAEPEAPPEAAGDPDPPVNPALPDLPPDAVSEPDDLPSGTVFDFESALLEGLPDGPSASSADPDPHDLPEASPTAAAPEDPQAETDGAVSGVLVDFASVLADSLSDSPQTSSDDPEPPDPPVVPEPAVELPEARPDREMPEPGDAIGSGIGADSEDALRESTPDGPAAALAFAADPETEDALREGLLHFEGPTPDCDDPQVWPGGLRAAVAALAEGHSTQLVIVDIDGIPYPAGAIHELAEVCEIGTVVIAVGSDDTVRVNREILLAGVSDYLVKPITAAAVREATALATASERGFSIGGQVAGFAGTGGSGTTTVAAATALHAAERGRYVSILDLNRTVPAMALLLDVEPAPGLDQLFDVAGKMPPDPQMLDGVRAERSERISLYAYRLGVSPPPVPPMPALDWLLGQLRHRSQLVLVDGLDDPEMHFALLAEVDARVLVVEPTVGGAVRAARILGLLGTGAPALLVQNHTREFKPDAGTKLLLNAGIDTPPDIVIPFEATLPEIADRGWPQGRLPRRLRKPVAGLADRILMRAVAGRRALPELSRGI